MNKMKLVPLFALAIFALSACKTETTATNQPNSNGDKKTDAKAIKLAVVTNNASDHWNFDWNRIFASFTKFGKSFGYSNFA